MEMKTKDFKKLIILILVAALSFLVVTNITMLSDFLRKVYNITSPFIIGACLAFILNIPMSYFERKIKEARKDKSKEPKWIKVLSLILAFIVVILVVTIIITLIVPELIDIINLLIKNIPMYISNITEFVKGNKEINNWLVAQNINLDAVQKEIVNELPTILNSSITIISSVINGITTFIISLVFAIYILIDKENLQKQSTRLIKAYLKEDKVNKILNFCRIANHTLKSFFTVQCLEASILGSLCIIGMAVLQIPYAIPVGVLIGVTALIPIIGAFIGAVIGAILILAVSPIKMVTFIIFILILQQVEGNLIYPKVVGKKVGLPGMWVLVAVTIGGSIGGVFGMLLGVPIVSIFYTLLKEDINIKLNSKK